MIHYQLYHKNVSEQKKYCYATNGTKMFTRENRFVIMKKFTFVFCMYRSDIFCAYGMTQVLTFRIPETKTKKEFRKMDKFDKTIQTYHITE